MQHKTEGVTIDIFESFWLFEQVPELSVIEDTGASILIPPPPPNDYSSCPATDINGAQFDGKSHLADPPTMYTSSLPYLPHIYLFFYC